VAFDISHYEGRVSVLEPLVGQTGAATLALFTVEALDQAEDYLIFAGQTDDGEQLEEELVRRLLSLPAEVIQELPDFAAPLQLDSYVQSRQNSIQRKIAERNARFFEAEAEKLDGWADDLKVSLEREIKELDRQIKEARRAATAALTLEEKLAGQKQVKALEAQRNTRRRALFEAQDEIDRRREQLIAEIEGKLQQRLSAAMLFTIRWKVT
jgi:adenine-specific DNA-methyltransferase